MINAYKERRKAERYSADYAGAPGIDVPMTWECSVCGALVADCDLHTRWHRAKGDL